MSQQNQQQRNERIRESKHDQYNIDAPETTQQVQPQGRGPKDRDPPVEISQSRESEEDSAAFIDESLLTDQDPNDTDADDEALVLDGVGREAGVEDEDDDDEEDDEETDDGEIADEEDSDLAQPN